MRRLFLVLAVTALVAAGWPTTQVLAQESSKARGTISALKTARRKPRAKPVQS